MEELNLPNSLCRSVDVTDLEAMQSAVREAEELYGKTDLLINCAGLMLLGYPAEQDFDEWSRMIDVTVKAVLSDMIARNEGTIINISSMAGRKTFDNHSVHCGTKYAVHAMTESMRREVSGSNVRMIVSAPGVVETPLLSHTSNQEIKGNYNLWKQEIDGGLEPSQIADCAWFAYQMPQEVCVREIVIAKTKQAD